MLREEDKTRKEQRTMKKKIDVSQFENYENLTAEEKVALYEAYEYEDSSEELIKTKSAFDKVSSEIASMKKQNKEKLSEEERLAEERAEELKNLRTENEALKREKDLGNLTAEYMSMGYSQEIASKNAVAFLDGDRKTLFANEKAHLESVKQSYDADALAKMNKPTSGSTTDNSITKDKFDNMGYTERVALKKSNPDLYNELNK